MQYELSVHCDTDIGLIRQNNEDAWKMLQDEQFFLLADGMGGHQAGEVASRETVERLCLLYQNSRDSFHQSIELAMSTLRNMIQEVNTVVYQLGKSNPQLKGMGTTLCAIFFHPDGLIYAHVGDSRIYRYRQGKLEQITKDHSLLRELIDLGQLSEQQAGDFLYKNIITKAIGTEPSVEPSIFDTTLEAGDVLLMCSDGLSDLVSIEEMQEIIKTKSVDEATSTMINLAKQNGGFDNITVVMVKVLDKHAAHLS